MDHMYQGSRKMNGTDSNTTTDVDDNTSHNKTYKKLVSVEGRMRRRNVTTTYQQVERHPNSHRHKANPSAEVQKDNKMPEPSKLTLQCQLYGAGPVSHYLL